MRSIIYFSVLYSFLNVGFAKNISVGITGIAKVGESCFLSILIKDKSNLKIKELAFTLFATSKNNSLLGKAKINLFGINKNQPYTTTLPVNIKNPEQCSQIKKVKIFNSSCILQEKSENFCTNHLNIDKSFKDTHYITTSILENPQYFKTSKTKNHFIKELGLSINMINSDFAKRYNISDENYGLIVTKTSEQNLFKQGDLIFEAEMKEIKSIEDFKKQIKDVLKEKKKHILINFIRENNKKLVAVKLK